MTSRLRKERLANRGITVEDIKPRRTLQVAALKRTIAWLKSEIARLTGTDSDYCRGKIAALTSALRMLDIDEVSK